MEPIANPWTAKIIAALRKSVEAILEVGRLLTEAKQDLPHGEFQHMIEKDLPFDPRQARVYMRVASDPRLTNRKHASVLPAAVNTLDVISRLSDHEFERRLQDGDIHPNLSRKDASALLKGKAAQPLLKDKVDQTSPFDESEFYLSGTGKGLERLIEEEGLAPGWLKLNEAGAIIEEIVTSVQKLRKLVTRIGEPDGVKKFEAEVARMEKRVTGMAEKYRRMLWLIKYFLPQTEREQPYERGD